MSKYIKYISSTHFGAPPLKGDRWGYCVEMLRKCLVEGFNERTDLVKAEVLDSQHVKYTFGTAHNYEAMQTIKISEIAFPELNGDMFITAVNGLEVTCKAYIDLTGMIGQVLENLSAKAIVAPLGFIEKFKDANRSVFTTDEEEAFLYIDDTQPSNWNATSTNMCITPLIYMTDKMSDINTDVGKVIFPFNPSLPNAYKTSYMEGTYPRNGLLSMTSYPITSVANKSVPINYTIIGNGRLFYFMPITNNTTFSTDYINTIIFGKYETFNKKRNNLPYILHGNSVQDTNVNGSYSTSRFNWYKVMSSIGELSSAQFSITTKDNKKFNCAVLSCDGDVNPIYYSPVKDYLTRSTSSYYISGTNTNQTQNTDVYNKKYYVSKTNINNFKGNIGYLSGLLWVYNANIIAMKNNTISKYRYANKDKYLYNYNSLYGYNNSATSGNIETVYNISLDYEDWRNYE